MSKYFYSLCLLLFFTHAFCQNERNQNNCDIDKYETIISKINKSYFQKYFQQKYLDDSLFHKATYAPNQDLKLLENFNIILESILLDPKQTEESLTIAKRALDYNHAYAQLDSIMVTHSEFYNQKFQLDSAAKYTTLLKSIELKEFPGLKEFRDQEIQKVDDYKISSCELKEKLDKMKELAKTDNASLSPTYKKLEKEYNFPYQKAVIRKMSKSLKSYDSNSLEDSCVENQEKQISSPETSKIKIDTVNIEID